ncbi:MAG: rRNA methyltransferase [Frankiales bacterium]|nr:rRNA methyltransferase [Frankiales bacterium]
MTDPVFFCPDLQGDEVLLDGPEGRHAALVRRLRVGESLDLVDGRGVRASCAVLSVAKESLVAAVGFRTAEPAPSPRLTVVQALAKGERGELAVELMTEVGVDEVVPWQAARCIAKWNDKVGARWASTALEASKQARRSWFLTVGPLASTAQVGSRAGLLVLHEQATTPLSSVPLDGDVTLVVGPEGGIAPEELAALGGTPVRLGPTVLRTSTAGAAAAAVLSARLGRW